MNRKIVISLLTTALLSTVPFVEAQQAKKVPVVGFLCPASKPGARLRALQQGLRDLGYVEGQSIRIESRFAMDNPHRFPELAAELVGLKVHVIVPMGEEALHAAYQKTKTIPIVMPGDGGDPVESGLVASLARPAGNVTGLTRMSPLLAGKRLELLKEAFPRVSRVAVLSNLALPENAMVLRETEATARSLKVVLQPVDARVPDDLDKAFSAISSGRNEGVIVLGNPLFFFHHKRIEEFLVKARLPAMYELRQYVDVGGLMSYGPDFDEMYRRTAVFVDKILKGRKPEELPVEQPMKFELVINLKTAKQIGLTIPGNVLYRADKVIK